MSERVPPKIAAWLLRKWGSRYHAESLAGDLLEQYREGRSRAWYWGQVAAAVAIAQAHAVLAGLITAAGIGYLISTCPSRRGRMHALLNAGVLAFGVIALGAGTLTWADTLRADPCPAAACVCPTTDHPSTDRPSIDQPLIGRP